MEELSVLTKIELPEFKAVKIYQAGIRSRSAVELSIHIENGNMSVGDIKNMLVGEQKRL